MVARNLGKMGRKGVTLNPGHFTQLGESILGRSSRRKRSRRGADLSRWVCFRRWRVRPGTWIGCSLHSSDDQHSRTCFDQGSSLISSRLHSRRFSSRRPDPFFLPLSYRSLSLTPESLDLADLDLQEPILLQRPPRAGREATRSSTDSDGRSLATESSRG